MELTWSLAKLALELESEGDGRSSSEMARAMEVALEKAEIFRANGKEPASLDASKFLEASNSRTLFGGTPCAAEPSQDCFDAIHEVIR